MRHLIALILIFIVPLQFAWSAGTALYGHVGENTAVFGLHDHYDSGHAGHKVHPTDDTHNGHNDDGHHDEHCHHVLSLILVEPGLTPDSTLPGGAIPLAPAAFLSRTPPLFDRPPLARA